MYETKKDPYIVRIISEYKTYYKELCKRYKIKMIPRQFKKDAKRLEKMLRGKNWK